MMNPLKCGSCDGPQVQHKNTHPQQNQQEVSRANSDCELSQANFIIPQVNAQLKRKRENCRIHVIYIISKVTNLIFSSLPTLVLSLVLFLTSTKTKFAFFHPIVLLYTTHQTERFSFEARVLLLAQRRPPANHYVLRCLTTIYPCSPKIYSFSGEKSPISAGTVLD